MKIEPKFLIEAITGAGFKPEAFQLSADSASVVVDRQGKRIAVRVLTDAELWRLSYGIGKHEGFDGFDVLVPDIIHYDGFAIVLWLTMYWPKDGQ